VTCSRSKSSLEEQGAQSSSRDSAAISEKKGKKGFSSKGKTLNYILPEKGSPPHRAGKKKEGNFRGKIGSLFPKKKGVFDPVEKKGNLQ